MHLDTWKPPLHFLAGRHPCPAPGHDSKRMKDWLKENLTEVYEEEVWPPSSPHCNSFRYILFLSGANLNCGSMQSLASGNKIKDLIHKIEEVMGSFNIVAKACKSLRSRIYTVVTADRSFNK